MRDYYTGKFFFEIKPTDIEVEIIDKGDFTEEEILSLFKSMESSDSFISQMDKYFYGCCGKYYGRQGEYFIDCREDGLRLDIQSETEKSVVWAEGDADVDCEVYYYYSPSDNTYPEEEELHFNGDPILTFTPAKAGIYDKGMDIEKELKPFTVKIYFNY
jgi:hypothetical protein